MHPAGRMAADRAARRRRLRLGEGDDAVGLGQDLLDQQACRDQRQKAAGQLGTKERRKGSLHVGATTSTPPPDCTKSRGEPRFGADPHVTASEYRAARARAFETWADITGVAAAA